MIHGNIYIFVSQRNLFNFCLSKPKIRVLHMISPTLQSGILVTNIKINKYTNCSKWPNFLSWSHFCESLTLSCSSHLQRWSIEYSKAAIWKTSLFPLQTPAKRNEYQSSWLFIHTPKSSNLSLYPRVFELSGMLTEMKRQWQRAFI